MRILLLWFKDHWRELVVLFAFAFVFYGGYRIGGDKVQAKWNKANIEAQKAATKIERQAAQKLADKQKELNNEKEKTRLAVSGATTELDGLRQTIANLKLNLPNSTSGTAPLNENLARSWDALESCSKEYAEVAKITDEQRDELAEWQTYGQVINDFRGSITKQSQLWE